MAQASSNDVKNWGSKISLDCPFKLRIRKTLFYNKTEETDHCKFNNTDQHQIALDPQDWQKAEKADNLCRKYITF